MSEMYSASGAYQRSDDEPIVIAYCGDRHYTILRDEMRGIAHGAAAFGHRNCSKVRYVFSSIKVMTPTYSCVMSVTKA